MGKALAALGVVVVFLAAPASAQGTDSDVAVTASPGSGAIPGQILVLSVEITNSGPWTAEQVVLGSVIPATVSIVDATSTDGRCVGQFGSLLCSFPQIETGTETVVVTLEVGETGNREEIVFTFFAQVFGSTDPDFSNNTATLAVPVVQVLAETGVETEVLLPLAIVLLLSGAVMVGRTRRFGVVILSERTYTGPHAISGWARIVWQPFGVSARSKGGRRLSSERRS